MQTLAHHRIDDLNISRLNLIVALDQIDGQREWAVTYEDGERIVKVSCRALPELGVPHGVDNDVNVALIDYFNLQGQPEDGVLEVSATQLLRLCGFHQNGRYYAMLKESLDRLHTTSYSVSGGWRDHPNRRWTHAKFHFIESLSYTALEGGTFDERSVIKVRLAEAIVNSLRAGYTKPLNFEFMMSLSRPRTRVLFRVLDAMRVNPERPDDVSDWFEIGLVEWADQCKIPSAVPGNVRRALQGPHDELIRRGYLRAVVVTGRGRFQMLRYEFNPNFTPMDPVLAQRFRRHGVTDGVARQLASEFPRATLNANIDRFEALVASGLLVVKKTPAAALVHLIRHPDQYPAVPVRDPRSVSTRAVSQKLPEAPQEPSETLRREFSAKTPQQAGDAVVQRLTLYFSKRWTPLELDALRQAVVTGQLDGVTVLMDATQALSRIDGDSFVSQLKRQLAETMASKQS
ncbi:replication initiator protein A (plasmid) [Deinococcus sp. KNUC1210]|uniref:replication initiator protein A n=1 Tax=Deinococcus sp. KNUC1210 TaxID=2917691 RepID=UPI001EF0D33A|nr:replication initiator protein A [Deinococcus sp. KNUC1210]ULH18169.1 replication initiator protein A [Deinococcus sp. KNUC1210]